MSIEVKNVSKCFGGARAIDDISLRVPTGTLVALLGPSGSGKTTLLRVIAGLEEPDPGSGTILFDGTNMAARNIRERKVGFVFQHYALFRHMNVFENIAFGLTVRPRRNRPDKREIADRVHRLLQLIQLEQYARRYPDQLSGGQRQRVALARALAVEPKILLLDEPFGALDAKVRKELRSWLRRLQQEMSLTALFVTHDQEEALEVADQVVILNHGQIEQSGTPDDVFHNPVTEFVMRFLGEVNIFHGRSSDTGPVYIRPHEVSVRLEQTVQSSMDATVLNVRSAGPVVHLLLRTSSNETVAATISQEQLAAMRLIPGRTVFIHPLHSRVFHDVVSDRFRG